MPKSYIDNLLGENEKILLITRQHWLVLLRAGVKEIILAILIVVLVVAGGTVLGSTPLGPLMPFATLLLLIPLLSFLRDYLMWANREYMITNLRVIQVSGFINKNVIDSSLEKVNDVKLSQSVFGRMFNYGNVEILTASELGVNLFQRIESPIKFKTIMLNAKERLEHGPSPIPGPAPVPAGGPVDIPTLIQDLDLLRQRGVLTEEEFQKKKAELLSKI